MKIFLTVSDDARSAVLVTMWLASYIGGVRFTNRDLKNLFQQRPSQTGHPIALLRENDFSGTCAHFMYGAPSFRRLCLERRVRVRTALDDIPARPLRMPRT